MTKTDMLTPLQIAEMGDEVTLQNVKSQRRFTRDAGHHDWEYRLTDEDITQISELLGGHQKTQEAVARRLRQLSTLPSHWCYDRIHFCKHQKRWRYTAGQDYPGELSLIRNYLKKL